MSEEEILDSDLLLWCQEQLAPGVKSDEVSLQAASWQDGVALHCLVLKLTGAIPSQDDLLAPPDRAARLDLVERAISVARRNLGVTLDITPEDFVDCERRSPSSPSIPALAAATTTTLPAAAAATAICYPFLLDVCQIPQLFPFFLFSSSP